MNRRRKKGTDLTFSALSRVNAKRSNSWHGDAEPWSLADWAIALGGEAGEVLNAVKKLKRLRTGIKSSKGPQNIQQALDDIAEEITDVVFYADLFMTALGRKMPVELQKKFNAISKREGFKEMIRLGRYSREYGS